ncbi:hypothetical protein PGT21_005810 [Puccinia graminis f. sp. tritici]|uniref:Uncharacterized protein n=1 Tax=Puccinia graminis f. sp. tritici TaxID=56615 RepID=A0A5B0MN00_PUCGR|nr:hypothetical protein PGT21_005810 [Puccinia graminis f. sp. tritici]
MCAVLNPEQASPTNRAQAQKEVFLLFLLCVCANSVYNPQLRDQVIDRLRGAIVET